MAFDGYMKVADIEGEAKDSKHEKWIEILQFGHEVVQEKGHSDGLGRTVAGRSDHKGFTVVKNIDKASPKLFQACCLGTGVKEIIVDLCRAGGDGGAITYMQYKLTDCVVAKLVASGDATERDRVPLETVSFNYATITLTYTIQGGGNVAAGWDVEHNKKC